MSTAVRRYLTIVQDARGYPPSYAPLEEGPPTGPAPPTVHQVVLADDYEALERAARAVVLIGHGAFDDLDTSGWGDLDPLRAALASLAALTDPRKGES